MKILWNAARVALRLQVSVAVVRALVDSGKIPLEAVKIGIKPNESKFDRDMIDQLIRDKKLVIGDESVIADGQAKKTAASVKKNTATAKEDTLPATNDAAPVKKTRKKKASS
ncbi:MAG: hypothetical protein LBQ66_09070 [Planctomycetaceae bacterium]|jgi:adenylosuccinate lyase|nr:hypothetical protein [Planctomycetaceae bacterium]